MIICRDLVVFTESFWGLLFMGSMKRRTCSCCGKNYPATTKYFYQQSRKNKKYHHLHNECKNCERIRSKQHYQEHQEERRKWASEYYRKNKQEIKKYQYQYNEKNREEKNRASREYCRRNKIQRQVKAKQYYQEHKEEHKIYNTQHRDKILKYKKLWRKKNKERVRQTTIAYRIKNREKIREIDKRSRKKNAHKISERRRQKYRTDIHFRLRQKLSGSIRGILRKHGCRKSLKTMELLGCSIECFKKHLEDQFTDGMTWDNYGQYGWHIDHIKPCAAFDLTKPEEQKKCFNYKNLQPMWWPDNLKKNSIYNGVRITYKNRSSIIE